MPINFLGASRNLNAQLRYTPKDHCPERQMALVRSNDELGSKKKPLILIDTGFWPANQYATIIQSIAGSGARDWTDGSKIEGGSAGINVTDWQTIRGNTYRNTEMIGAMVAMLTYNGARDVVVSAAPNLLYNSRKPERGYMDHLNSIEGTQIHPK